MSYEKHRSLPVLDPRLKWVERVSNLMDNQFRLPGTSFRFGLDPIINFVPLLGDLSGFLISATLVLSMARHGVSRKVVILMVLNILLDAAIGAIPLIGWIFDFSFKANTRNINLLRKHYTEGKYQGSGKGIIMIIVLVLIVFLGVFCYLLWLFFKWLAGGF
ncbi:DUF4112 domain-containing protein [Arcticibacter sp. MXS-1]|uniref:DUF4112 domain-containing protein n=1 Tax=Arcticibacter sp. MXS-1 TaxID=3341726 RepID=UPI0035A8C6B6